METNQQFNIREQCANIVKSLHEKGISIIPLNGKQPCFSVKWKQYQRHLPAIHTLQEWIHKGFKAYGIICGQVSQGITVVDFDCMNLYQKFCDTFQELCETYTVKTKRGYHVYFKSTFTIAPRSFDKCDIKGDGGYVVGAGSTVDEYTYQIYKKQPIHEITYKQYKKLVEWLQPTPQQLPLKFEDTNKSIDLTGLYLQYAQDSGRNNALYKTALYAKHQGIAIQQVNDTLIQLHIHTPAKQGHRHETHSTRQAEAKRTIKSAYQHKQETQQGGLPNFVREAILKLQKSTIVARLIDGIRNQKTIKEWITSTQLTQIAQNVRISKASLYRVLRGDLSKVNGRRIFKQHRYDSDKIEINDSQGDIRKPNSKVGRPIQFMYRVPSNTYLCKLFKTTQGFSDVLQWDDLKSAGAYRRALHRELIRRLTPMIRVQWFAERLGVHRRTIFRYHVHLGVEVKKMTSKRLLKLSMIPELSDQHSETGHYFTPGRWIETRSGKKYPALQVIANTLVTQNENVWLCQQLPSQYALPSDRVGGVNEIELPDHLKSRAIMLTPHNLQDVIAPDWATDKFDLGGYLAVYDGGEWKFRPPLRVIAYPLVKRYEEGLIYFIRPLKRMVRVSLP